MLNLNYSNSKVFMLNFFSTKITQKEYIVLILKIFEEPFNLANYL